MTESRGKTLTSAVEKYSKQLFGFVKKKVSNQEDAEDILQEVWFQFSNLANLSDIQNTGAWLYSIARNKIIDLYRKQKPSSIKDFEAEEENTSLLSALVSDTEDHPELEQFKEVFWEELMEGLEELPPNQREVFVLNELEDLTLAEIAEKTGENLKTVISRKGYAVKYLRKKLAHLYQELNN